MRPMGPDLLEWARGLEWFSADDLEVMQATYDAELARHAALREYRAGQGAAPPLGRPLDWALDGTERRGRTEPGYHCHTCRDSGWVRRELPVGDPDYGKAQPCRCRATNPDLLHAAWARRAARAGLPPDANGKSLDSFSGVRGATDGLAAAREFLHDREQGNVPRWVAFYGGTGRGKTHLLAALANAVLLTDSLLWATVPEFLDACQAPGLVDGETKPFALDAALTQAATQAPVLILDEFGSLQDTPWSRRKLETLLNARYEARRPTLLGCTIAQDELAGWSPRIGSRLGDAERVREVVLTCDDFRKRLRPRQDGES